MSLLTRLFGNRSEGSGEPEAALTDVLEKSKTKNSLERALDMKKWRCVLVPAHELPYSERSLAVASRLAKESNARVLLVYLVEVHRSLSIDEVQPEAEQIALNTLSAGEAVVKSFHVPVETRIFHTRNVREGIRKLIQQEAVDLLILGRRHDDLRGLQRDVAKDLFDEAPCEVIVDYIAQSPSE